MPSRWASRTASGVGCRKPSATCFSRAPSAADARPEYREQTQKHPHARRVGCFCWGTSACGGLFSPRTAAGGRARNRTSEAPVLLARWGMPVVVPGVLPVIAAVHVSPAAARPPDSSVLATIRAKVLRMFILGSLRFPLGARSYRSSDHLRISCVPRAAHSAPTLTPLSGRGFHRPARRKPGPPVRRARPISPTPTIPSIAPSLDWRYEENAGRLRRIAHRQCGFSPNTT